jgi:hypothetical protein
VSLNFSRVVFSVLSKLGATGLGLALQGTVQSGLAGMVQFCMQN